MKNVDCHQQEELRDDWNACWQALGLVPPWDEFQRLVAMYAARRGYHSLSHLLHVMRLWRAHFRSFSYPGEAGIALFFHDAVYVPGRSDNEARSADLAREVLTRSGAGKPVVDRVGELVLATRHATVPVDADAQLVVDIDLSILGASMDDYARYVEGVRKEYAHVPGFLFNRGRRKLLEQFLARERIFLTSVFAPLEQRARENLRHELQSLNGETQKENP